MEVLSMKIGQFCETYPPMLDGVGKVMLAYCKTLNDKGHDCVYVAPRNSRYKDYKPVVPTVLYHGIPVPTQPYSAGFPNLSPVFLKKLREMNFDVVHAHGPFFAGRAARRVARKLNIPLVSTFHSKYYDDFYRITHSKFLSQLIVKYIISFYNSCDEVWTLNEGTKKVLQDYGYKGPIVIIPNGTDPYTISRERITECQKDLTVRENLPVFLFVGQIDHKKNIGNIIEACRILHEQGHDFEMLLAGQGADLNTFKKKVNEYGLNNCVHFIGFIGEPDLLHAVYDRADLLVFPSIYDNASMVVREAATMKTPPLLVRGSCTAEGVIHGENGYLCENTPEDIALQMWNALPTIRETGEKASQTIPVAWSQIMDDVISHYTELAKKKKSGTNA